MFGSSKKGTITGRPAKPGEVANKKAKPATGPRTGPVTKAKPPTSK
jgi:hypothetical protein